MSRRIVIIQGHPDPEAGHLCHALADAYDTVLVECGPAEVEGVRRLTRSRAAEIILSIPGADEDRIVELIGAFGDAGYSEIVLLTGDAQPSHPGRRAA